jgi:hypothetical protein
MCCFPGLLHFVERIRGGRSRAGNVASLALLEFMRGLLNTLRANLHDPMLVPVDQMLMHGMDSKDIRTRFRTYGFSVLMRVACSGGLKPQFLGSAFRYFPGVTLGNFHDDGNLRDTWKIRVEVAKYPH